MLLIQCKRDEKGRILKCVARQYTTYETRETQYSTVICVPGIRYICSDNAVGIGLIKLMQCVKSDAKKAVATETVYEKTVDAKMIDFDGVIYEYDKTSAYLQAAHALNIVSDKTYLRLKSVTKRSRLIAIGSLATTKVIRRYENGVQIGDAETKRDEHLYGCWIAIVNRVAREMRYHLHNSDACIAYWFDAIYATREMRMDETYKKVNAWRGAMRVQGDLSIITKGKEVYVRIPVQIPGGN